MSDPEGLYKVLGLPPNSSIDQIKQKYHKLQKEYHPDFGSKAREAKNIKDPKEREKRLEEIKEVSAKLNAAKATLFDEEKKKQYDTGMPNGMPGGFSDIFDFFSGGGRRKQRKVEDTIFPVKITMKDAYKGITKKYKVNRSVVCGTCSGRGGDQTVKCSTCSGRGSIQRHIKSGFFTTIQEMKCTDCDGGEKIIGNKCKDCKGKKYAKEERIVEVEIPKGVGDDECIKFNGLGDERIGALNGDLIFNINITDKHKFIRTGNDLIVFFKIDLCTALTGGKIYHTHLDDKVLEVEIPPVRNFNDLIKIKGYGFGRGDLYLKPEYDIPEKINGDKLREVLGGKIIEKKGDAKVKGKYEKEPEIEEERETDAGFGAFRSFFNF